VPAKRVKSASSSKRYSKPFRKRTAGQTPL